MKTIEELNQAILKKTMTIKDKFPELSKYIEEMPVTIPDVENPEITIKSLKEYYDSLDAILKKYAPNHIQED
jgi:hypothetical protein